LPVTLPSLEGCRRTPAKGERSEQPVRLEEIGRRPVARGPQSWCAHGRTDARRQHNAL